MRFTVYGHPETAGSKRAFAVKRGGRLTGKVAVVDDNRQTKSWQSAVRDTAVEASGGKCLSDPVYLSLTFYLHRPKGHYRSGRYAHLLRERAPRRHMVKPDLLKLTRAVEDALTGVVWKDDAQICEERLSKRYASADEPEHVVVVVSRVGPTSSERRQRSHPPMDGQLELTS